ncbi:MAG: hypothetical protein K8R88_14025 [Armatimonadetes bacterium]|nr:hypothetical protein [Armatimonadota bacterium]
MRPFFSLFAILLLVAVGVAQPAERAKLRPVFFNQDRLLLQVSVDAMKQPKKGPKGDEIFTHLVAGYGLVAKEPDFKLRLRVYCQEPIEPGSKPERIARFLMNLWQLNMNELSIDHSEKSAQIIDVYLSPNGKAGGEQFLTAETTKTGVRSVNAIYIYDWKNLGAPLELIRELAHEYGHATLPPIGGFKKPEEWANGHLGERLYLLWMLDNVQRGNIDAGELVGTEPAAISDYLKKNVSPYVFRIMDRGPRVDLLKQTTVEAMNEYLGLVMAAESFLPHSAFARSLVLPPTQNAMGYYQALRDAVDEIPEFMMSMAGRRAANPLTWLPIGKGKVTGGTVLERNGYWAKVKLTADRVEVKNPAKG